jgi:hypothetical protein
VTEETDCVSLHDLNRFRQLRDIAIRAVNALDNDEGARRKRGRSILSISRRKANGESSMKKKNIAIRYFVTLMLMTTFAACASTSRKEGTGEYVDNSVITGKIKSQLAADDFLRSFDISVETYKGAVRLSGDVDSQSAVNRAGQIARGVDGVRSAENNLKVKR